MHVTDVDVIGVFQDRVKANETVMALESAGFARDQIGVVLRHPDPESLGDDLARDAENFTHLPGTRGAVAGAVTGLGLGALAGLGVLSGVIPVLGPAIVGGTMGVIFSNAAAGAGIAGLMGILIGAGVPNDEANYYVSEFEAGRILMTVHTHDRRDEAYAILRSHGAYDVRSAPDRHQHLGS